MIAAIRKQDLDTGCGDDGLHVRIFSCLAEGSEQFVDVLLRLYRCCMATGRIPRGWRSTVVHLLTKDPKRPRDADNLKPITLSRVTRRLFERIVLGRFDVDGFAGLHPAQGGFRRHSSTYVLAATAHHLLSSGIRRVAVFLDFEAAFDVVDLDILKEKLTSRGFPGYLLAILESLMLDGSVTSRALVNGVLSSETIRRTRGLLQGSVLSPYLFNIYVDDLVARLNAGCRIPVCLFYADDGLLLTESRDQAQALVDEVVRWCETDGQRLRIDKCAAIDSLPPSEDRRTTIKVEDEPLPQPEEYRYLGFPMGPQGIRFERHVEGRMASAVGRACWLMLHIESWTVAQRLEVYHAFLLL